MKGIATILLLIVIGGLAINQMNRDDILGVYNGVILTVGNTQLTSSLALKGERAFGQDHFTGAYAADYDGFSGMETLFGGTYVLRATGEELHVRAGMTSEAGSAKLVFLSGGKEPVVLLEGEETYDGIIALSQGGNYFAVQCDGFTGSVALQIE